MLLVFGEGLALGLDPLAPQPAGPVETFSQERATETIPTDMRTDDAALILLRFANGARGSVVVSQVSAGRKNSLQWDIAGTAASAASAALTCASRSLKRSRVSSRFAAAWSRAA